MTPPPPGYEKAAQPDPCKYSFGFGARACPGRQFAEKSLLLSMVGILAGCNIKAAEGATLDDVEITTGHTRYAYHFFVVWVASSASNLLFLQSHERCQDNDGKTVVNAPSRKVTNESCR